MILSLLSIYTLIDKIRFLGFTTLHDSRRYIIPRCLGPSHPDTIYLSYLSYLYYLLEQPGLTPLDTGVGYIAVEIRHGGEQPP